MKKLFLILFVLSISTVHASVLDTCLEQITAQDKEWHNDLFDKNSGIFSFLGDTDDLTDEIVQSNKEPIYRLLATKIVSTCESNLVQIAKQSGRGQIPFSHNNKEYAFDFDVKHVFDYIGSTLGFVIINNKNLSRGEVFNISDIPKKVKFFNADCSAQKAKFNIPDDAAINVAGQAVFTEFGGSKNEFYIDYTEGNGRRAFPGLVIKDETRSPEESIVVYQNLPVALERYEQFGEKLKTSACANQGLALYLVSLPDGMKKSKTFSTWNWIHIFLLTPTTYAVSPVIEKIDSVKIIEGPYPL